MSDEKEPKIIIDDDWKSQVEAEKEVLQQELEKERTSASGADEMPPASFPVLVTTLASQAMVMLGQIPDPVSKKPVVNKPMAKHFIDTLEVLEKKTTGNLDDDESAMLTQILHQLRMLYVNVKETVDEEPAIKQESSIELP